MCSASDRPIISPLSSRYEWAVFDSPAIYFDEQNPAGKTKGRSGDVCRTETELPLCDAWTKAKTYVSWKFSGLLYRFSCCLFIVYGQIQWSIMIHLGYSIFHYKWVILCFLHSFRGNRTLSYKPPSELTFVCFDDLYLSEELCSGSVCSCEYMFFFPQLHWPHFNLSRR